MSRTEPDPELVKSMMGDLPHLAKLYEHGNPEPDPKRLQRGLEATIGRFLPL